MGPRRHFVTSCNYAVYSDPNEGVAFHCEMPFRSETRRIRLSQAGGSRGPRDRWTGDIRSGVNLPPASTRRRSRKAWLPDRTARGR